MLPYMVPASDHDEFFRLPTETQDNVRLALRVLQRVDQAPKRGRVRAMKTEAARMTHLKGWSWQQIRRKYYAYQNGRGDWRTLVDRRVSGPRTKRLNPDFVRHLHSLSDDHPRAFNSAIDELYAQWFAGEEIPGYGTWREWWARQRAFRARPLPASCPRELPPGWSRANLQRHKPHKTQQALTRQGIAAALATMPTCITTREGLRPFEFVVFDDAETDFLVCHPETAQVCKVEGLFAKDVATDCWLRFGLRPGIKRDDDSRQSLCRQDMLEMAVQMLTTYGYPRDYTSTWIVERGTATISEDDAAAIYEATGGKVIVSRTGMISGRVRCEGYADKPVGNYRGKSWIEGGFGFLWNKLDRVRGQKSSRYDTAHRELETRKSAAVELMRAGKLLSPEEMMELRLPFEDLRSAFHVINQAMLRINRREQHACEGFRRVTVWRFRGFGITDWQPYHKLIELPEEVRDKIETASRVETPQERMESLMREHDVTMDTLHPAAVARILNDYHRKATVIDGEISLRVDGKLVRYFDADSPLCSEEGAEYLAYLPKGDLDVIYLTDGAGAFKGVLPRRIAPRYGDLAGRNRQLADRRKTLARHVHAINKRHVDQISAAIRDTDRQLEIVAPLATGLLDPATVAVGDASGAVVAVSARIRDRAALARTDKSRDARDAALAALARRALLANA